MRFDEKLVVLLDLCGFGLELDFRGQVNVRARMWPNVPREISW